MTSKSGKEKVSCFQFYHDAFDDCNIYFPVLSIVFTINCEKSHLFVKNSWKFESASRARSGRIQPL